jgi:hypothetical protein
LVSSVFIFGVPTGQEAYPPLWAAKSQQFYVDAASKPPLALEIHRAGNDWIIAFISYRCSGSAGRANSHFGIGYHLTGRLQFSTRQYWNLSKQFFDFLVQSGRILSPSPSVGGYYEFSVASFSQLDPAWIDGLLSQLREKATAIHGWTVENELCAASSNATATCALDDEDGPVLGHLLLGHGVIVSAVAESTASRSNRIDRELFDLNTRLAAISNARDTAELKILELERTIGTLSEQNSEKYLSRNFGQAMTHQLRGDKALPYQDFPRGSRKSHASRVPTVGRSEDSVDHGLAYTKPRASQHGWFTRFKRLFKSRRSNGNSVWYSVFHLNNTAVRMSLVVMLVITLLFAMIWLYVSRHSFDENGMQVTEVQPAKLSPQEQLASNQTSLPSNAVGANTYVVIKEMKRGGKISLQTTVLFAEESYRLDKVARISFLKAVLKAWREGVGRACNTLPVENDLVATIRLHNNNLADSFIDDLIWRADATLALHIFSSPAEANTCEVRG